jgi:hypothetical protein
MSGWTEMKECMQETGCSEEAVCRAEYFYRTNAMKELLCCLRSCRSSALEKIHEKQRQLDRLDKLIRDTKNK